MTNDNSTSTFHDSLKWSIVPPVKTIVVTLVNLIPLPLPLYTVA